MQILILCNDSKKVINVDAHDIQTFKEATELSNDETVELLIRRNVNILLHIPVVYFTKSMLACMELLLHKRFFLDSDNASVTALISSYEKGMHHKISPHMCAAIEIILDIASDLANVYSTKTTIDHVRHNVYPQCNIRTMCFIHQLLKRIISCVNGQQTFEKSTYIDQVAHQIFLFFKYFWEFSDVFPCHLLNTIVNDIESQLQIFYTHRIKPDKK